MTPTKTTVLKSSAFSLLLMAGITTAGVTGLEPTRLAAPAVAEAHAMGPQSDLRLTLNRLLSEHVTLAAAATGAALGGRNKEFEAAAAALDMNSQDLAKAIGSVYGEAAGEAFLPLWRKHIGFFVDYTVATAKGSGKGQKKAVDDLVQYADDFGAFLSSATPSLPKAAVADLVKMHILSLKDVVDAQANRKPQLAYQKIREASMHMQMIADPLADAIIKQFPEKFRQCEPVERAGRIPALSAICTGEQHEPDHEDRRRRRAAAGQRPDASRGGGGAGRHQAVPVPAQDADRQGRHFVTWMNGDDIEHSVTAGKPGKETKAFDSGFFVKDQSYSFSFTEPGTYSYFCKRHPSMTGTVKVE